MVGGWWLLALLVAAPGASGFSVDDSSYLAMPRLFQLDDASACAGLYCLGSFQLRGEGPLMEGLKNFSSNTFHFNHTRLHRGYCMSRCAGAGGGDPAGWFEACVSNATWRRLRLRAELYQLEYCRGPGAGARAVDALDVAFAYVVVVIVALNLTGSIYDLMSDGKSSPNRFLIAWSLRANWRRLVATHEDGDPLLSALRPLQGMKVITLLVVLMAHTKFAEYMGYSHNTQYIESTFWQFLGSINGSLLVQTFVVASSFLLAYNLLLLAERQPEMIGFRLWLPCLLHRLIRILPVYMFVVGLAATWWERATDGTLWAPLLAREAQRCRRKWWTHLLFLNTFLQPDDKCQLQTWFISADMQLHAALSLLLLALLRRAPGRGAVLTITALFVLSVLGNGVLAYVLELKPILYYAGPEFVRAMFNGLPSFPLLYAAPWGSLPSALLGLLAALLLRRLQARGTQPRDYLWFRLVYRSSGPALLGYVAAGYWLGGVRGRLPVAALAALDRPAVAALVVVLMIGCFTKVDDLWWRFLSWQGFQILGRLSLPVLMLHWNFCLTLVGVRLQPSGSGILEPAGSWLVVVLLSYLSALPLALLLELPSQRTLQTLLGLTHKQKQGSTDRASEKK